MFKKLKRRLHTLRKKRGLKEFCNYLAEELESKGLRNEVVDLAGLALDSKPAALVSETFDNEKLEEIADMLGKKVVYSPFNHQYLITDEMSIKEISNIAFDGDFYSPPEEELEYIKKRLKHLGIDTDGKGIEELIKLDEELTEKNLEKFSPDFFSLVLEKLEKEEHQRLGEAFGIPQMDIDDFYRNFENDTIPIRYPALSHSVWEANYVDSTLNELREAKIWSASPKLARALNLDQNREREKAKRKFGRYVLKNRQKIADLEGSDSVVELLSVALAEKPFTTIHKKSNLYKKLAKRAEKCGLSVKETEEQLILAQGSDIIEKLENNELLEKNYDSDYEAEFIQNLRERCFDYYLEDDLGSL